jgi:UDP-glucose 4-epimerase
MTDIKNKKIAITGGAGFIGSNLTRTLSKDNQITVIDDLSSGNINNINSLIQNKDIDFIKGSVTDLALLIKAIRNADYVFHLAAIASVPQSMKQPIKTIDVNVNGTLNVLIAADKNNVKKVVNTSSCAVYGDPQNLPIKEKTETKPISPYSVSKLSAEHYCNVFSENLGLSSTSLRYFNVYGPMQNPKSQYAAVVPIFISQILSKKPITIFGDGLQTRDFIFVQDIVNANIIAAKSAISGEFNVGSGKKTSINQIANLLMKLIDSKVEINYEKPRPGDIKDSYSDITKIKNIGFELKTDLEDGLKKTIDWYKSRMNLYD